MIGHDKLTDVGPEEDTVTGGSTPNSRAAVDFSATSANVNWDSQQTPTPGVNVDPYNQFVQYRPSVRPTTEQAARRGR